MCSSDRPTLSSPVAPKSSRRRRLWDLPRVVLCPVLEEPVQRDIHMLQHQAGTGVRLDVQRLQEVVAENAVLTRELAAVQARVTRQMADKALQIERQQAELVRLRAQLMGRDTLIACLREDASRTESGVVPAPADTSAVRLDLAYRLEWRQQQVQTLTQALERSERQVRRLQARLSDVGPAAEVALDDTPVPDPAEEAVGEPLDLQDKAVLCVGGRTASVPVYRREIETRGARFLHHDGGEEDSAARLDAHLEAADLVICQTGCISHGAYWRVKDHCKRTGKRCVFVDRPSASGLVRGLDTARVVSD